MYIDDINAELTNLATEQQDDRADQLRDHLDQLWLDAQPRNFGPDVDSEWD